MAISTTFSLTTASLRRGAPSPSPPRSPHHPFDTSHLALVWSSQHIVGKSLFREQWYGVGIHVECRARDGPLVADGAPTIKEVGRHEPLPLYLDEPAPRQVVFLA